MLSLESADIEGFDVFLLFHTDLKSEGCSADWLGELADKVFDKVEVKHLFFSLH